MFQRESKKISPKRPFLKTPEEMASDNRFVDSLYMVLGFGGLVLVVLSIVQKIVH